MHETLADFSLGRSIQPRGMIQKVGVIGCGAVGQEITRAISQYGIDIVFLDLDEDRIKLIFSQIEDQLDDVINHWGLTPGEKRAILSRIKGTTDYNDLADCDIVIESISSRKRGTSIEERKEIFKKVEAVVREDAIISSNIATLMISDLAAVLQHPERAIGIHFILPVHKSRMIEVVKGISSSDESYQQVIKFAGMINKKIVRVNESPGNIVTRMLVTTINEACEILMEGVASVSDIDTAMKESSGNIYGPFEMADRIGLDKILKYMDNLYQEFGDKKYKPSPIIKRLVRANYYGRITNRGFYNYESGKSVDQTVTCAVIK
ncbi:MAG: 3-hydroxyacyl-CoA dehydrogenase NAD-binding domain-containing protein [Bacteroidales bacterium]|nr:3-hydroxyacyl-CoA dehydrogenase NAD-binding domain-containing protein [Bacteroidales bacterium]HOI32529.1 3-hydroxyacyl-CoA dehydrogenase NAD-binding domain-containing protein [Bacteroidales bacterium]